MANNELPDVHNIFYYPTLRYYPKDSKYRPYNYDGGLSLEEILQFIKRVSHVQLVVLEGEDGMISEQKVVNDEL